MHFENGTDFLAITVVGQILGHSPIQAMQSMLCTAWIGECPHLKTVSQSMTHDYNKIEIKAKNFGLEVMRHQF